METNIAQQGTNNQPWNTIETIPGVPNQKITDIIENGEAFSASDNQHGFNYQSKIQTLYLCLGRELKNFHLAAEVKAGDKFDDLIFCYQIENAQKEKQNKYCLLQTKHMLPKNDGKENATITPEELSSKNKKSQFGLLKYFKSYVQIRSANEGISIQYLILFTNHDFDYTKLKDAGIEISKIERQETRLIPKEDSYKFTRLTEDMRKLFKTVVSTANNDPDSLLDEFLGLLVFAVNQPNYLDIENTIKIELGSMFNLNEKETDVVFEAKLGKMWNIQSTYTGQVMTPASISEDFNKLANEINEKYFSGITFSNRKEKLDIENYFQNFESIYAFLNGNQFKISYISSETPALSCLKIAQALQCIYQKLDYPELYFAIVDLLTLEQQVERLENTFRCKKEFVIVIKCDEDRALAEEYVQPLLVLLKNSPSEDPTSEKKLVFVCGNKCNLSKLVNCHKSEDTCQYQNINDTETFLNSRVNLQGHEIEISEMIKKDDFGFFEGNVAFCNEIIEVGRLRIGKEIDNVGSIDNYYIGLLFKNNFKYCKSLQNIPKSIVLVFSITDKAEVEKLPQGLKLVVFEERDAGAGDHRAIFLSNEQYLDQQFKEICREHDSNEIHWLEKHNDSFIVKKSVHQAILTMDTLIEGSTKVNVLIGEPGSGKTVALTKILNKIKHDCSTRWTIKISLMALSGALEELRKKCVNMEGLLDFLCLVENLKNPWEKELLRHVMLKTHLCHLFFDGFDEICPAYESTVIQMLKLCKETKASLWVTSRQNFQAKLEIELDCCSYSPIAFSKDKQKSFLNKYWLNSLGEGSHVKVIQQLFSISEKFVDQFIGIPLHTLMIANISHGIQRSKGNATDKPDECESVDNILAFYDLFIAQRYESYFVDKAKLDTNNPYAEFAKNAAIKTFSTMHKNAAIKLLFARDLHSLIEGESTLEKELHRVGLLVLENGRSSFIHKTIAEYFVAKRLGEIITDKRRYGEKSGEYVTVIKFLKEQYFAENTTMIRIFLDLMMITEDIHKAIIKNDLPKVKQLLKDDARCIAGRDLLNRTAWHLAASYSKIRQNSIPDEDRELWKIFYKNGIIWHKKKMSYKMKRWHRHNVNSSSSHQPYEYDILNECPDRVENSCSLQLIRSICSDDQFPINEVGNFILRCKDIVPRVREIDKLNFNVLCYAMAPIEYIWGSPSHEQDETIMKVINSADCESKILNEIMINALQMACQLENNPTYAFSRFNRIIVKPNAKDFWKHSCFIEFLEVNIYQFKRVKALMKIAHSAFPWESCSEKFIDHILQNDPYFCNLLADKGVDLSNLWKRKGFLTSEVFKNWFTRTFDKGDCESLRAAFMHFSCPTLFSIFYKPSPAFKNIFENALAMVKKEVGHMQGQMCNYSCGIHADCLEHLLYAGHIYEFQIILKNLKDDITGEVLDKFNYAAILETLAGRREYRNLIDCLRVQLFQSHTKEIKTGLKLDSLISIVKRLYTDMDFINALDIYFSLEEKRKIWEVLSCDHAVHDINITCSSSDTNEALIFRWLDCYPRDKQQTFNWSIWEHIYCTILSLAKQLEFPPNILKSIEPGYINEIVANKHEFRKIEHIFHLATDEQKRNVCRSNNWEFLLHAISNYFGGITNEKCGNGAYLRVLQDDIPVETEEFEKAYIYLLDNDYFSIAIKFTEFLSLEKQLKMCKTHYIPKILTNKDSFQRVSRLFHLATDEQRREICKYNDCEFLFHAINNYFDKITNETCGNGAYLSVMLDEISVEGQHFQAVFSNVLNRKQYSTAIKLIMFLRKDKRLALWKTVYVNHALRFKITLEKVETDFIIHLLKVSEAVGDQHLITFHHDILKQFSDELSRIFQIVVTQMDFNILKHFTDELPRSFQTTVTQMYFNIPKQFADELSRSFQTAVTQMNFNILKQFFDELSCSFQTAFTQMGFNILKQFSDELSRSCQTDVTQMNFKILKQFSDELSCSFQTAVTQMDFNILKQFSDELSGSFQTAVTRKDFHKLNEIFDKYSSHKKLMSVMWKNVKASNCIDYINYFFKNNNQAILGLLQYVPFKANRMCFFQCHEFFNTIFQSETESNLSEISADKKTMFLDVFRDFYSRYPNRFKSAS